MESKKTIEKRTPSKKLMQSILMETVHGKLAHNTYNCDSPFRLLPNISTPPSRFAKIVNPFESHILERLHVPVFSPSVFKNVPNSITEEKFKWTIDDISSLKPAEIDETTVELFASPLCDREMEFSAQAKIDTFFNEKLIVPSPYGTTEKIESLLTESISPVTTKECKHLVDGVAQTVLTLPPTLPDHVTAVLRPYFSFMDDQQQGETNINSSLYRKLFEYDDHDRYSNESAQTSPAPSCNLSPIQLSPFDGFGSPADVPQLRECNLSPIIVGVGDHLGQCSSERREFSGHMSVDMSLNLVPDTLDQIPPNHSAAFESIHSPIAEVLSDSTINWDMEYKHVTLISPDNSLNSMDISNSYTPKSKIFTSQRKKLSDSFLRSEEAEENKENRVAYDMERQRSSAKSILCTQNDSTDPGYHTGCLTVSEESWSTSHLFASTPTKYKN